MGKKHFVSVTNLPEPLSTEDEEVALKKLKSSNDSATKKLLVEHNLRLVQYIVNSKFLDTPVDADDLFIIGSIGLIKGIDTFDISREIKLATYTSRCIENEIRMYLRKMKKLANDVSIEDPIAIDFDGRDITIYDILSKPEDEEALYRCEKIEYTSVILSIFFGSLPTKKLLVVLYTLAEMKQREIGKHLSLSQSYVSRLQKACRKKSKEIREFSNEELSQKYALSQSNKKDFIFFLDNRNRFCLSCHSKFSKPFLEFMKPYNIEFETADNTGRMIIGLPIDENSYVFCAELIKYISEHHN